MQLGTYRGAGGETVTLLKEMILRRRGGGTIIAIFRDIDKEIAMEKSEFQTYYEKIDDIPGEVKEAVIDVLMDMRDLLGKISNDITEIKYNTPSLR